MEKKAISIGTEDFKEILDKNGYLVDKTMMIRELLDSTAKVTLFTRPRRFGKTLNLSMLRRFFEDERRADGTPVDNRYLFEGLAISACGEMYLKHQQQYPVISLSLKEAGQDTYEHAFQCLKYQIEKEFDRHRYVLTGQQLLSLERERFERIMRGDGVWTDYAQGLEFLSKCLTAYHGRKTIILLDEYDVPLEKSHFGGYYDEMVTFIRTLFSSALKTNDSLELGVITGCLRISKESIFTGLNNLMINSVHGYGFDDCFGFTQDEVKNMLDYYDMGENYEEVQRWYDGYLFDQAKIYNPWSILNYVNDHRRSSAALAAPYWSNTSSNSIVKELVEHADQEMRGEIEQLIAGEALEKPIHEDITYEDVYASSDNLWNFLYFTGYLTSCGQRLEGVSTFIKMVIPNDEVRSIFQRTVLSWFDQKVGRTDLTPLRKAIEGGDCDAISDIVSGQLMDTISFFDYGESYYHGFLAGLLKAAGGYLVLSNRENGAGRTDIVLKTQAIRKGRAIIIEIKVAQTFGEMEKSCQEALKQIRTRQYEEGLRSEGYRDILKYGICFYKKECIAMSETVGHVK